MAVSREKIKSVVAYIASKVRPGKVKLFKLMYLADFEAQARLGRSITDDLYENFEMGPVPRTLWNEFARLVPECVQLKQVDTGVIPEQQMRIKPGFEPDLDPEEQAILDGVLAKYGAWTGNQLRDYTHTTLPYRATPRGETISYGLAGYCSYQKVGHDEAKAFIDRPDVKSKLRAALENVPA